MNLSTKCGNWGKILTKHMVNVLKFQTLFSFQFQIKYWLSGLELFKILVRITNREDPDQTASSEVRGLPAYTQSTQLRTSIFECPKDKNVLNREKCNEKHASHGLGL